MSDTEKKSNEPESDNFHRETVFHYSREHRLSRASPEVQALNEGTFVRPSFFKTLFATKSHRLLLFAIVFVVAGSGLAHRFTGRERQQDQGLRFGGNTLVMTIVSVEGALLLEMIKSAPQSGELYIGPVEIVVSPAGGSVAADSGVAPQVFTHRIFFNPVEIEIFRISLPFEETDFFVILNNNDEQRSLRLRVRED